MTVPILFLTIGIALLVWETLVLEDELVRGVEHRFGHK